MQCTNNLKQIGLSLHNYHDVNLAFPAGCNRINAADGLIAYSWGWNWRTSILLFMEQQPLYDSLVFGTEPFGSGGGLKNSSWYEKDGKAGAITHPAAVHNKALSEAVVPPFFCPSFSYNVTEDLSNLVPGGTDGTEGIIFLYNDARCMNICYTGIRGGWCSDNSHVNGMTDDERFKDAWASYQTWANGGVWVERNIFDVENDWSSLAYPNQLHYRTMADVIDGTSNTMIVAEQSGRICSQVAGNILVPINSNYWGAWSGGYDMDGWTLSSGLVTTWTERPINSKTCYGAMSGSGTTSSPNTILNSEHAGGINILLGDGSVRFLSDTVSNNVYWPISNMNDGFSTNL